MQRKLISEVCHIKNGNTPAKANSKNWNNGTICWFRVDDIRGKGRVLSDSYLKIADVNNISRKLFPANSIILSTSATIGEYALVTVPHLANERFVNLSVKEKYSHSVDHKFLFHYAHILSQWCKQNTVKAKFEAVDMAAFREIQLPIPSLEYQRSAVSFLGKLYNIILLLQEERKKRDAQFSFYLEKILSSIPKEQYARLGDVATSFSGLSFPIDKQGRTNGDLPFYKVADMNAEGNSVFMGKANNYVDYGEYRKSFPKDTVIFPKNGMAITTNKKRILTQESIIDNNTHGVIPGERLNFKFIYFVLLTIDLITLSNGTGGTPTISKSTLENVLIPCPNLNEQERIVKILDVFLDIRDSLNKEIDLARARYDKYVHMLLYDNLRAG